MLLQKVVIGKSNEAFGTLDLRVCNQLITSTTNPFFFALYILEDQRHERQVETPYLHVWQLLFGPFVCIILSAQCSHHIPFHYILYLPGLFLLSTTSHTWSLREKKSNENKKKKKSRGKKNIERHL